MYKLPKSSGLNWHTQNNYFVPNAISCGCSHCNRTPLTVTTEGGWSMRDDSWYKCTKCPACGKIIHFWLLFREKQETSVNAPNVTDIYIEPTPPLSVSYDCCIDEISPFFRAVYNQAVSAEENGLDALVGMGYRKALEFLLKDWICSEHLDDEEEIKKMSLGKCVHNYISDVSLKNGLERTIWLGNDETHYVRTWPEKDILDLKILLEICLRKIAGEIMLKKLPETMPRQTTS